MTGCTSGGYDQLETSPETTEQELRPAVCGWLASNRDIATAVCMQAYVCGGVQAFARVRAHACVCVRACMRCLQYTIILFDTG